MGMGISNPHPELQQAVARAALSMLPGHHVPASINGQRQCVAYTDAASRRAGIPPCIQQQYMVSWQPTVEEDWSLYAWKACGYQTQHIVTTTIDELEEQYPDLYDNLTCEICNSNADEDTLYICDNCNRMYHQHCIELPTPPTEFICEFCLHNPTQQRQLYVVHWADSYEPATLLSSEVKAAYHAKQEQQALPDSYKRPDRHCTNMEKQGIYGDNPYIGHLDDPARRLVTFHHKPVNPHTDIPATGSYCVQIREILTLWPGMQCDRQGTCHPH
jgi:hypothetical protein